MKTLIKLTLAFVLGITVTAAVVIPKLSEPEPTEVPTTADIQTQISEAVDAAVAQALAESETEAEPQPTATTEVQAEQTVTTLAKTLETAETLEPTSTPEVKATPEPTAQAISAPSPQVTKPQTASVYPKEWIENGQKYAYLTAYAEEHGIKTEIHDYSEGETNAVQEDYYDWESDPLKDVPGPFTGNGSN
jgi:MarR-like DNA-binding transcriptional regulator SgrR of sgrS sRNA